MELDRNTELTRWIGRAAWVFLEGSTSPALRQYSFAFDADAKSITLKAEVDRPLTEDERDDLDLVETEMYAQAIFDTKETIETLVVLTPPPQPLEPLPGGIVFNCDDPAAVPSFFHPDPGPQPGLDRSGLTADAQTLLDAHTGKATPVGPAPRGQPGFRERLDAGEAVVGCYVDPLTGEMTPTTRGTIHYSPTGAHIIPSSPRGWWSPSDTPERVAQLTAAIGRAAGEALRHNTPAPLRQYSFALDAPACRIALRAEVARPLIADERERLAVAESELYAHTFLGGTEIIETTVVVSPRPAPLDPLPGGVVCNQEDSSMVPAAFAWPAIFMRIAEPTRPAGPAVPSPSAPDPAPP